MKNNKKQSYVLILILCFCLCLSMSGCEKKDKGDASIVSGNDTETGIAEECLDFTCVDKDIYQIAIPESNKVAYLTTTEQKLEDTQFKGNQLYKVTNNNGKWEDPQEITFTQKGKLQNVVVSVDGKTLYVSYMEEGKEDFDIGYVKVEEIKENTISEIIYIDELNTSSNEMIGAVDQDGTLYYNSIPQEGNTNDYFVGNYDGSTYSKLRLGEEINRPSYIFATGMFGITVVPDGSKLLYTSSTSELVSVSSFNLFEIEKDGKSFKNAQMLDTKINQYNTDILRCSVSGDGKTLYYCAEDAFFTTEDYSKIQAKWYKIPLKDALAIDKSTMASYDTTKYDTAEFPLKLRDKGEEAKKAGIFYEIFVRAFADSDGDGIGDFNGITNKLDYLEDLGVTGLWLMPINKSYSYHGYDVVDYYSLNSDYGTEEDFKNLIEEAHKRGIKVIMDLVINHTAMANPWFLEGLSGFQSKYTDYYRVVAKENGDNYSKDAVSPWGSPVWNGLSSSAYAFYGIFSEGMPDLNYNNPEVRAEIKNVAKKWLDLGVDGYRLDAAMHIYGDHEFEQQSDQTAHNVQWWNEFAKACEEINPEVYLVGEAWQNEEVLPEYVQPFDTKFNFAFTQAMMNGIKNVTAMVDEKQNLSMYLQKILDQYAVCDTKYLDGVFASNHDQDRVMSQLQDTDKAKLAVNIYMTLSGNPYIYYGEELGMQGRGNDEYKRTAFKWNADGSAPTANWLKAMWKQEDTTNTDVASLEEQENDPDSLYQYYKNIIALRKNTDALMNGTYTAYDCQDSQIMSYIRESEKQKVLVIHNFADKKKQVICEDQDLGDVLYASTDKTQVKGTKIELEPYSSIVIELQKK
ncbi:alpha-amylase family glycosyl hydrolase [Anaerosporobacter faecicola]|uniref:alpha-amylase family glycosyl hydrolase n=1 Tax=Anaerosporobacter faecicola TaxID=2718714 RepID=UPI00143A5F11|nr:alpha-amylase family glycosyl hydrolase [Anaerosporobacter faecicola]